MQARDAQGKPRTVTPGVDDDDVDLDAQLDVDDTDDALDRGTLHGNVAATTAASVHKLKGRRSYNRGTNVHVWIGETTFDDAKPYS